MLSLTDISSSWWWRGLVVMFFFEALLRLGPPTGPSLSFVIGGWTAHIGGSIVLATIVYLVGYGIRAGVKHITKAVRPREQTEV